MHNGPQFTTVAVGWTTSVADSSLSVASSVQGVKFEAITCQDSRKNDVLITPNQQNSINSNMPELPSLAFREIGSR